MKILGLSGSLRKGSYNTALLRAASDLLPDGMTLEIADLAPLPLYNADHDGANMPDVVRRFKDRIARADALLIATPEYNYSVSGVLKNAIDWASRPAGKSPLIGKPTAIMGATTGLFGTVRAQMHLREICLYNDMPVVRKPEVLVMGAAHKFDSQGSLTDKDSREFIRQLLANLAALVHETSANKALA
jgi:chromate reductase